MIITEKKVLEIKDNVKCPQLGSCTYGKWGTLKLEQRLAINDLCDSWLYKNELLDNYVKNWNEFKNWLEEQWKQSHDIWFVKVIGKMQELEQGKDESN